MEGIKIARIRIKDFKSLKEVEFEFGALTVLTGSNNAGKSSILEALRWALSGSGVINSAQAINRQSLRAGASEFSVDLQILPYVGESFSDSWVTQFGNAIRNSAGVDQVNVRVKCSRIGVESIASRNISVYEEWELMEGEGSTNPSSIFTNIELVYIPAQRDIVADGNDRKSRLRAMAESIQSSIPQSSIDEIREKIAQANEVASASSEILVELNSDLKTMLDSENTDVASVEVTPFFGRFDQFSASVNVEVKLRSDESLTISEQGTGTRAWSSAIVANAYMNWKYRESSQAPVAFHGVLCCEEPEVHLHPNAQSALINKFSGGKAQIVITTHSPTIVASTKVTNIRRVLSRDGRAVVNALQTDIDTQDRIVEIDALLRNPHTAKRDKRVLGQERSILANRPHSKISRDGLRKIQLEVVESRGEIIFAKKILLFEGATELVLLPFFFHLLHGRHSFELGVEFVPVHGMNYIPFFNFCEHLGIAYVVLSDNDGTVRNQVESQLNGAYQQGSCGKLHFLSPGNDVEAELRNSSLYQMYKDAVFDGGEDMQSFDDYKAAVLHGINRRNSELNTNSGQTEEPIPTEDQMELLYMRSDKTRKAYQFLQYIRSHTIAADAIPNSIRSALNDCIS